MNRVAAFELLQRVKGSVAIAEWFLTNEDDDVAVALELLGRANMIEAKLVELRGLMARDDSGRPDVHVIGDRPGDVHHHYHVPPPTASAEGTVSAIRHKIDRPSPEAA